ncbi:MAG: hypothetical protein ACTSPQ_22190 [Candidatus Helarchaeota archaeon]
MPSFKIYKISTKILLDNLFTPNWMENIKPLRGDLEVINQKIHNLKKYIKVSNIFKNEKLVKNAFTISYQYQMQFSGNIQVWIPENINLIQQGTLLYISRGQGNIRYLIEKFLENNINILPKDFKPKVLMKIWNNLKNYCQEEGYNIKLHRIILNKVYLNGDFIRELNLSTNNLQDLGYFKNLVQNSEQVRVITFKIRWNMENIQKNH